MNGDSSASAEPAESGPRRRPRLATWILTLVVSVTALALGLATLGMIKTGAQAENTILAEASRMVGGDHRYGIVEYTHYPNGPTYLVAAMSALGLRPDAMRALPILVSAASLGFLAFVLAAGSTSRPLFSWVVVGFLALFLQPGFAFWQGALHEHSYAVSIAAFAIALSARPGAERGWLMFPLGFVAGWIGYDWLPGQAAVVLGARWLVHGRDPRIPIALAGSRAAVDALKFASGAALAILAHLLQLALFFDDFETAARDLLGSAATRAGAEQADRINPEYYARAREGAASLDRAYQEHGQSDPRIAGGFSPLRPIRSQVMRALLPEFFVSRWTSPGSLLLAGVFGLAVLARELRGAPDTGRGLVVGAAGILAAFSATVVWSLLMPQHAAVHLHMLPRHFLLCVLLLIALPILLVQPPEPNSATGSFRQLLRPTLLYALFPILMIGLYMYALLGLDAGTG